MVGASPVVVPGVLGQNAAQVALTEDEHPVGDLGPGGERKPFGMGVDLAANLVVERAEPSEAPFLESGFYLLREFPGSWRSTQVSSPKRRPTGTARSCVAF
jgi:hypothetical protein